MSRIHRIACIAPFAAGIALALTATATARAQNLLTNPSFEDGITSWSFTGNDGVTPYATYNQFGGTGNTGAFTATFGNQFAAFNGGNTAPNGVVSQTFATTPGTSYLVTFYYGDFSISGANTQSITASAISGATTLGSVTVTDSPTGNQTDYPTILRTASTFSFAANAATTTLSFADGLASQTGGADGFLDNISVVAVVPESGTVFLLSAGIVAGIGITARRRRT